MRREDEGQLEEHDIQRGEPESLADQALEAIVRSQELRARSRNLRKKSAATDVDKPNSS